MALTKRKKANVVKTHGRHDKDTGSAEVQVAMLKKEIDELAKHLKENPNDGHSRRGLLKKVSRQRKLMDFLKKKDPETRAKLAKSLGMKK